jgi:hypothetical protein
LKPLTVKFSDVAEEVFLRCMTDNKKNPEHRDYAVIFNYEFLDDVYANWSEKGASEVGSGSGMFFDILCTIFIEYRITTVLKVEQQLT